MIKKSKKHRYLIRILAVIAIVTLLLTSAIFYYLRHNTKPATAAWYNASWNYRQTITLTNNGSLQSNHVVEVTLDSKTLIDAAKLQSDCDDIRFTSSDGSTLIDYFTDYCSNTTSVNSSFFVEVPSIAASTTTTIYLYYGNSGATAVSSFSGIGSVTPSGVWLGTGKDSAISVTSDTNINTADSIGSRACTDAGIAYDGDAPIYTSNDNIAATETTIDLATSPDSSCLAAGDEVLIFNAKGTSAANGDGKYEFARIVSISTNVITLNRALINAYNGTNREVIVQRVPNYTNVTLTNSGTDFVPSAWDGTTNLSGGVMAFRASGTVSLASGTTINGNALGYAGGAAGTSGANGGGGGESYNGASGNGQSGAGADPTNGGGESGNGTTTAPTSVTSTGGGAGGGSSGSTSSTNAAGGGGGGGYGYGGGGGGGGSDSTNNSSGAGGAAGTTSANGGGGGGGINGTNAAGAGGAAGSAGTQPSGGGGGGQVGSGATQAGGGGGDGSGNSSGAGGGGGGNYGSADLSILYFGSGGGGGGGSVVTPVAGTIGAAGGGVVYIQTSTLSNSGTIESDGGAGNAAGARYAGGGGAGAGGSVLLSMIADTIGTVTATGGAVASNAGTDLTGAGAGGDGRVHLKYTDSSAPTSTPTANTSQVPYAGTPGSEIDYATYQASIATSAYWKFDEGYGTTAYGTVENAISLSGSSSSTGLQSPSATGEDHNAWTTPSNAYSSNESNASTGILNQLQDYYNFGFSIPADASILGIEVKIEGGSNDTATSDMVAVELSYNGGTNYTSTAKQTDALTASDATYTLGGAADTWGRSWTDSELSNANFRVRLQALVDNGGGSSFPKGSLLLNDMHEYVPIETFKAGDKVMSLNIETREFFVNEIEKLEAHPKDHIYTINGEVKTTNDELIFADRHETPETDFAWIRVDSLAVGDTVIRETNKVATEVKVATIEIAYGEYEVYTVQTKAPFNNYFVDKYLFDVPSANVSVDHLQVNIYYSTGEFSWKSEEFCVFSKCGYFDGTNNFLEATSDITGVKTVAFWVRPMTTSEQFIDMDGTASISSSSGTVSATSFTSPTIYVNGKISSTITANQWNHIAVTTNTGIDATAFRIARISTNYGQGYFDEVRLLDSALSADQVKALYNSQGNTQGANIAIGGGNMGGGKLSWLSDGLVGYWKFDESSGDASDYSGNGTTLTNNSTTPYSTAKFGNSGELDGSTDYFEAADTTPLSITGSVTLSAWINNDDTTGSQNILGKWDGTNNSYLLALEGDELRMYIDSASDYQTTSATNLSSNTFTHVAGVYDSSSRTVRLFVNGVEQASSATGTIPASIGDDAGELVVGADDSPTNYFDGHIDEARVYNRAFSSQEVQQLYEWAPGPVGYWNFNENTGTTAYDTSTNGRSGTLTSGPTWTTGQYGSGIRFDNSDDYIEITSPSLPTADFTYEAWVNPTTVTNETIFYAGNGEDELFINIGEQGTGLLSIYIDNTTIGASTNTISANVWSHITVIRSGSAVSMYINGVKDPSTLTDGDALSFSTCSLLIGTHSDASCNASRNFPFNGTIDDVRIYNYARTSSQIIQDMNAGHPLVGTPVAGPVGHWKFDEGSLNACPASSASTFPTVAEIGTQYGTSDPGLQSYDVDLPNTISSGNLLIFMGSIDGTPTITWPSGWTELYVQTVGGGSQRSLAAYRIADGGEGATMTVTQNSLVDENFTGRIWRITNWHGSTAPSATSATGTSTTPDPPSNTPSWGSANTLWIAHTGWNPAGDFDPTGPNGGYPTNYNSNQENGTGGSSGGSAYAAASRELAATSDDPDTFTLDASSGWAAHTIAVRPEAAAVPDYCDSTPNGNHLEYSTTTGGHSNDGRLSKAYNGTGAVWASRADDADFDFTASESFSLATWFRSDSANNPGGNEFILNKSLSGGTQEAGYAIYTNSSGHICAAIDDDSTWTSIPSDLDVNICTTTDYYDAAWHHIITTRNTTSDKLELYIDGKLAISATDTTTGTLANGRILYLGDRQGADAGDELNGDLDEVKIYRAALTSSDVLVEYNQGKSLVLGALSTESNGTSVSNSSAREYCVPGDTSTCNAPVAEWKFDENSGTTANDTSSNNNSVSLVDTPAWSTGRIGQSLLFNGTSEYGTVSDSPLWDSLDTNITLSAWVKGSGQTGTDTVILRRQGATAQESFALITIDQVPTFKIRDTVSNNLSASTALVNNQWHFIAGTYDGTTMKIYQNGVLSNSIGETQAIQDDTTGLTIGAGDNNGSFGEYFPGNIDQLKIFDYARTASQVAWDYSRGAPLAWWKFDETSGTTAYDSSQNGHGDNNGSTGTLTNTPTRLTTARVNGGIDFDGADDLVSVTNNTLIDSNDALAQGLAYSFWVYPQSDGETDVGRIFEKTSTTYCRTTSDDATYVDLECSIDLATDVALTITDGLRLNQWNHVVMGWTNDADDEFTLWINGKNRGSSNGGAGDASADSSALSIGGATVNFDGYLDEFKVFNYEPTQKQVELIMNEGLSAKF